MPVPILIMLGVPSCDPTAQVELCPRGITGLAAPELALPLFEAHSLLGSS